MPPKDNGKVIVSLLAGATAGILAGLLLAPETGDEARKGLREAASKWGGSLSKLVQDALSKLQDQPTTPDTPAGKDRSTADSLLHSMRVSKNSASAEPGDLTTSATGNGRSIGGDDYAADDNDLDYDGSGGDARHRAL